MGLGEHVGHEGEEPRKSAKEARKKMHVAAEWLLCRPVKRPRMPTANSAVPRMVISTVVVTISFSGVFRSGDTVKLDTSKVLGVMHHAGGNTVLFMLTTRSIDRPAPPLE
ncbi:hypothetical protein GUJ93_ZPchr0006g45946 [Zizania palustris]|uniref:Uncharacterized protein n=1 Tax=Zizania palustris TaxID=103762 RepID=A0A8J5VHJ4_ZIZPA|nr:hypothetical protein GUJ93_ZPchr0006g45946 [Zizania palustris]